MKHSDALKLEAAIDGHIGQIVTAAEHAVSEVVTRARAAGKQQDIRRAQFRNVLAVASTAPHPAVITSFIRYQMGRKDTQRVWKDTGLGAKVIGLIDKELAEAAASAVKTAGAGDPIDVQVRMARLLLGFADRRFVYESPDSDDESEGRQK
jgi:hypothetical protein